MDVTTQSSSTPTIVRTGAFRFILLYLVLYNLPFPFGDALPGTWLRGASDGLWQAIVPWVGREIMHLAQYVQALNTGSGDTTFDYVKALIFAALSLLGAALWTVLDRKPREHASLREALRIYVRYALAFTMLHYGLQKVFPLQFGPPTPDRLLQTYGESSPMGLLWTFMGASPLYRVFGGVSEMLGGALLLSRRTTTVGALVVVAVMTNVLMLNFGYDVPVKLYTMHLLAMAAFLVWPDVGRLANVLVLNRATQAAIHRPRFALHSRERALFATKIVFVVYLVGSTAFTNWKAQWLYGTKVPRPALYGAWDVVSFTRSGGVVPPLITDGTRWRLVTLNTATYLRVRKMTDEKQGYTVVYDGQQLTLQERPGGRTRATLTYERPTPDQLLLSGELDGEPTAMTLKRRDEEPLLLSRGFRWIAAEPLNR